MLGKKLFAGGTALFGIALAIAIPTGCSSADPAAKCSEVNAASCDKFYTCFTGPALDFIKMKYGATVTECKTNLDMTCKSTTSTTTSSCPSGQTYDSAKADRCIAEYKAASCDTLMMGAPASCQGSYCK